jgi:hypothetical protein
MAFQTALYQLQRFDIRRLVWIILVRPSALKGFLTLLRGDAMSAMRAGCYIYFIFHGPQPIFVTDQFL